MIDGQFRFPEVAAAMAPAVLRAIGTDYVMRMRALAPNAERMVDKTLGNFLYAG